MSSRRLGRGRHSAHPRAPARVRPRVRVRARDRLVIAAYTLVDEQGIEHASPLPYLELVLTPVALVAALGVRRPRLRAALRPVAIAAGLSSFGAYALVLAALQLSAAAPVAAVRETGVVIAVALAVVFLRERVSAARAAGAALVVSGVALLSL